MNIYQKYILALLLGVTIYIDGSASLVSLSLLLIVWLPTIITSITNKIALRKTDYYMLGKDCWDIMDKEERKKMAVAWRTRHIRQYLYKIISSGSEKEKIEARWIVLRLNEYFSYREK